MNLMRSSDCTYSLHGFSLNLFSTKPTHDNSLLWA